MSNIQHITDVTALSDKFCENLLTNKKFVVSIRLDNEGNNASATFLVNTLIARLEMISARRHTFFHDFYENQPSLGESFAGLRTPWPVRGKSGKAVDGNPYSVVIGWITPNVPEGQPSCDSLVMQVADTEDVDPEVIFDEKGFLGFGAINDRTPLLIAVACPMILFIHPYRNKNGHGPYGNEPNYWGEYPLTDAAPEESGAVAATAGRVSGSAPNSTLLDPHPSPLFVDTNSGFVTNKDLVLQALQKSDRTSSKTFVLVDACLVFYGEQLVPSREQLCALEDILDELVADGKLEFADGPLVYRFKND